MPLNASKGPITDDVGGGGSPTTTTPPPPPPPPLHICDKVRTSCSTWMGSSNRGQKYVRLHTDKLAAVAARILDDRQQQQKVQWDEEDWHYQPPTTWPDEIRKERIALYILALDAINFCFWPNSDDDDDDSSNCAAYSYEYANLACTLTSIAQADHVQQESDLSTISPDFAFLPATLQDLTVDKMRALLQKHFQHGGRLPKEAAASRNDDNDQNDNHVVVLVPPDLDRRCALWNEIGRVLLDAFDGSALTLIRSANQSAVQLVQLLYNHFPGFRDRVEVSKMNAGSDDNDDGDGEKQTVYFLKRAQICVGDWCAALELQEKKKNGNDGDDDSKDTAAWNDMDQLTTFADYRLPQLLRHWQVLEYCNMTHLPETVDGQLELQPGSDEEISIRAATVVAVERLVGILNDLQQQQQQQKKQERKGCNGRDDDDDDDDDDKGEHEEQIDASKKRSSATTWTSVQVDWYLWQVGERMDDQGELQPHHRVRTIYY